VVADAGEASGAPEEDKHNRVPGGADIWVLLGGDFCVFSLFFATYAWYWQQEPLVFSDSQQQVDTLIGFANTLLLLTGSWLVASAMRRIREGELHSAGLLMGLGSATGFLFLLNKSIEWTHLFNQGIAADTNIYFTLFFMLTGIHGLHVIIGTGVLVYFFLRLRNTDATPLTFHTLEGGALFWHLVDVLWIVLFALVYLVS